MKTIALWHIRDLKTIPDHQLAATVAVIGWFDGVHLGHQKLIQGCRRWARELGLPTSVLTFTSMHSTPDDIDIPRRTTSIFHDQQKKKIMQQYHFRYYFEWAMHSSLMKLWPHTFLKLISQKLRITHVVVGADFAFGRQKQGTIADLKNFYGADHVRIMPLLRTNQTKIASRKIKQKIQQASLATAYQQLYERIIWPVNIIFCKKSAIQLAYYRLLDQQYCVLPSGLYYGVAMINNTAVWGAIYLLDGEGLFINWNIKIYQLSHSWLVGQIQWWCYLASINSTVAQQFWEPRPQLMTYEKF